MSNLLRKRRRHLHGLEQLFLSDDYVLISGFVGGDKVPSAMTSVNSSFMMVRMG
jgi:hypothetical protein